jgi:acetyl esterase/lipase
MLTITAVWLRRIGTRAEVLVEIPGRGWVVAITEDVDANYSHIAEGNGAVHWTPDYIVAEKKSDA